MLVRLTTPLATPRVFECVSQQRGGGTPLGFLQIESYVIGDVIARIFTVYYDIYNSQHPELVYSGAHPSLLYIVAEIALLVYLQC